MRTYLSGRAYRGLLAVVLAVIFLLIVAASGCGGQAELPEGQPSGIDTETVDIQLGAEPIDETQTLSADELLTGIGSSFEFLANKPGTSAAVDFDLEGPWNFRNGPDDSTLTVEIVDLETITLLEDGLFGDAAFAVYYSWTPSTGAGEYNLQGKDASSWISYGRFGPDERVRIYSSGVKALGFPAAVGDSWTESYTEKEGESVTQIVSENLIVARNRLSVPAGTFDDAYLMQTRVTATSEGGEPVTTYDYIWLVPGIGRAAEIISLPGQETEEFDTAAAFYRLQDYQAP